MSPARPAAPRDSRATPARPVTAYVGLGSNQGDRRAHLEHAVAALRASAGLEVVKVSPWIETEPVGGPLGQGMYLNGAVELRCRLSARELLGRLAEIERERGRERRERWGPRTLDLDLLLYGDARIDEPDLVVPHPRLCEREFVLVPLAAIGAPRTALARVNLGPRGPRGPRGRRGTGTEDVT